MTVIFDESIPGVSEFPGDVWQDVASKSGTLRAVKNYLHISAEYNGAIIASKPQDTIPVEIRALINGVEVSNDCFQPLHATKPGKFCDFGIIEPVVEGEYTILLQVRAFEAGQTVNVRRIRLMVMQV